MASVKVKFRPSAMAGNEGTIFYQIIHDRKQRQLTTRHRLLASEWDEKRSMVAPSGGGERGAAVAEVHAEVRADIERFAKIIRRLDGRALTYTADDVVDEFIRMTEECSLFRYMEGLITYFRRNGNERTAETYMATLRSFRKFHMGEDIMLDCLDSGAVEAYAAWLRRRGLTPNTISFYNRILRAAYNRAVEDGLIENRYPFRHVYTGVDKTVKRALPLAIIRRIKDLDLSMAHELDFARDMFMMSFMLRGMSFIDMAFLLKKNMANGYVSYRRRKTGQRLIIKWTVEMQAILDKYPENQSVYLLPIIPNPGVNPRSRYRNVGYNINRNLKRIGESLGLAHPLTLYVARHSWASAAKAKGIPLPVISEGMGHDSEATTRIYLAELDTSAVDQANQLILHSL